MCTSLDHGDLRDVVEEFSELVDYAEKLNTGRTEDALPQCIRNPASTLRRTGPPKRYRRGPDGELVEVPRAADGKLILPKPVDSN